LGTSLDIHKASRNAPHEDQEDGGQENDQEVDRDETDPYNEVIFGRRRPVSLVVDWTNKRSLEKVAGEAEG